MGKIICRGMNWRGAQVGSGEMLGGFCINPSRMTGCTKPVVYTGKWQ